MGVHFTPKEPKPTPAARIAELEKENRALQDQVSKLQEHNAANSEIINTLLKSK